MTRALGPGLKPPWTLLGAAAVLAIVLGWEWIGLASGAPAPAATAPASAPPPAAAASFDPPPLPRFAEIAERPLFLPGRRPQADDVEPAKPTAALKPPALAVQGVVLSPERRYAVIAHGNPVKYDAVAEGDTVEGWRVDSIDRDRVALSAGDAKVEVPVGKFDKSRAAAAPGRTRGGFGVGSQD